MNDENYYVKLGIAVRMDIAFKKFCDETYELKELLPKEKFSSENDRKINTTFEIFDNEKNKVATFHPSGKYHCLDDSFRTIFDKIVEDLNYGASKAAKAQDDIHDKMTKEFESRFEEK